MSGIKIWIAGIFLCLSVGAQAADRRELPEIIATCAGRMSAELEFAWLLNDPEAETYETQRARFVEILEALGPAPKPHRQLATRIDAKMAHATLLTTAYLGMDKTRAAWAKRHAVGLRLSCQNMLLDS